MIFLKLECIRKLIIALVLTFSMLIPFLAANAAGKLERGKDWISNGLIKVTVSEKVNNNLVVCFVKNADGEWKRQVTFRDNGAKKITLHDEDNEEIEAKVDDDKSAEILFKKVDRKLFKSKTGKLVGGKNAWKKYKISIFPGSYEIRIECIESSDSKKCNWYIMGRNISEYLMTETDIKDAADCELGSKTIKVGDPAYAVIWGVNSEYFYMIHWTGMKKVNAWRNKNKKWYEFITNIDQALSVYIYPVKKMVTDNEIKKICRKMLSKVLTNKDNTNQKEE